MRVILIIFLILFFIVSSLFLTTFIGKISSSDQDMLLAAEYEDDGSTDILREDSNINNISDIKPDTVSGLDEPGTPKLEEGMSPGDPYDEVNGEMVEQEAAEDDGSSNDVSGDDENSLEDTDQETESAGQEEVPEQDTVKIYLDGDMENGIYLGAASYGLDSSRAVELFNSDFSKSGYKFEWTIGGLELEPGSTHFLYIYYYSMVSGWDHIRKTLNVSGQKTGNSDIKIFIDKPVEQKSIEDLSLIEGWAVNTGSTENTGIGKVKIYLDGPMDFGRFLGDASYGIPRTGVAEFFSNNNYLYSGFSLGIDTPGLEPGSKHTLFIYAFDSSNPNIYNFEERDIFLSGQKEDKSLIEATISLEDLNSSKRLSIEGFAIDNSLIKDYLEAQKAEQEKQVAASTASTGNSINENGYSVQKLVFRSNQDGNYNIYSINLDGTGRQRLTDYNRDDLYPEVSPDGKKIAYTSDINGIWQIMIMDWDGQNKKQITRNSFRSAYSSWSYDMRYIYFEAYIDGDWELFRINSDGSGQKRLTHNSSGHDWHPNGHPFDTKIIFESGMPGHDNIFIMNHDGSSVSRLFNNNDRRRTPDLSNDATKITYTKYFGDNSEVYYADIRDLNEIRITRNGDWDGHPMFSPDDHLIVYEERSGGKEDLIIFDIRTGTKTNITNSAYKDSDASFMYQ